MLCSITLIRNQFVIEGVSAGERMTLVVLCSVCSKVSATPPGWVPVPIWSSFHAPRWDLCMWRGEEEGHSPSPYLRRDSCLSLNTDLPPVSFQLIMEWVWIEHCPFLQPLTMYLNNISRSKNKPPNQNQKEGKCPFYQCWKQVFSPAALSKLLIC